MPFFTKMNDILKTSADLVALGIKNLLTLSKLSSDARSVPGVDLSSVFRS